VSKAVKTFVHKALKHVPEVKYTNTQVNGLYMCRDNGGASAAYFCLTDAIPQGTGDTNTRIGDQISLVGFDIRFLIAAQAGAMNPFCRIIIFQYHEFVTTAASIGSALEAILPATNLLNVGAGSVLGVTSPYDIDRERAKAFTILYDKNFNVSYNTGAGAYNSSINNKQIHIKRKLRSKLYYANESTTNARNHIFVLAMSNDTYSTANNPQIYMGHQTMFTDA